MMEKKKKKKVGKIKKERKKERKKKNKIETCAPDFLDCEEKTWDSGAIFYIRIAKSFHL